LFASDYGQVRSTKSHETAAELNFSQRGFWCWFVDRNSFSAVLWVPEQIDQDSEQANLQVFPDSPPALKDREILLLEPPPLVNMATHNG
jgi:hypothetical protein